MDRRFQRWCGVEMVGWWSQGRPDFLADSPVTIFWVPWGMYEWPLRGFGPGWSFSDGARAFYKITRELPGDALV